VLVIAEDFILGARVESWKGIHPSQQIFNLVGQCMAAPPYLQPFPSLLKGLLDCFGEGLTGFIGYLPGQALGLAVLDAQAVFLLVNDEFPATNDSRTGT
jgi:hypothetical protein